VIRVVCLITLVFAARASAQQPSEADRLFEEGRQLAKDQKYAEACEKFEKSFAIDSTVGTELNLADCHEHLGHLRRAWELFTAAAEASAKTDDQTRTTFAQERADAVAKRLATIVIHPPEPMPPALTIIIAGRTLTGAELRDRVDPGDIEISVSIPDRPPYTTRVTAAAGATIDVPIPPFKAPIEHPPPVEQPTARRNRVRLVWAFAGAGGASALTATILTLVGRSHYNKTADGDHCDHVSGGITCDSIGDKKIHDAQHLADIGTGFAVGSLVLVGAAAALYFTAPKNEPMSISPAIGAGSVGVSVRGAF